MVNITLESENNCSESLSEVKQQFDKIRQEFSSILYLEEGEKITLRKLFNRVDVESQNALEKALNIIEQRKHWKPFNPGIPPGPMYAIQSGFASIPKDYIIKYAIGEEGKGRLICDLLGAHKNLFNINFGKETEESNANIEALYSKSLLWFINDDGWLSGINPDTTLGKLVRQTGVDVLEAYKRNELVKAHLEEISPK